MNNRLMLLVLAAAIACLASGVVLVLDADPVIAKDVEQGLCRDALNVLYTDCKLHLGIEGKVLNYSEAVAYCENQTDLTLKSCWTGCALNTANDCGEVADCIDECYNGITMCNFTIEFIYDLCDDTLYNPENDQPIDRTPALNDCETTGGNLWDCYTNCAYTNWEDCIELSQCVIDCAYNQSDDDTADDDTADDDTVDNPNSETLKESNGEALEDVHGSACGF